MKKICIFTLLCFAGCASTQIKLTGSQGDVQLCQSKTQPYSALILWGPVWRPNQKDVPLREIAALQGIEDFSQNSACYSSVVIRRLPGERIAEIPTELQIQQIASATQTAQDRIVVLTVHELGPVIQIGGPIALFGGGTEVVLEAQIYDGRSGQLMATRNVRWSNGGSFVIKGVKSLPNDMRSAIDAVFGLSSNGD